MTLDSDPILSYQDGGWWVLRAAYRFDVDGCALTVPEDYRFDLASIPRPFWVLAAPFELSVAAPLLHDFLYGCHGEPPAAMCVPPRRWTRAQADRSFLDVMAAEGVDQIRRRAAYLVVRMAGWWVWRRAVPGAASERRPH